MGVICSREEFANRVNAIIGERIDDDAVNFVQDIMTTYDSLTNNPNTITIEQHNEDMTNLENEWKEKYKKAFLTGPNDIKDEPDMEHLKIEDLFK